MLIIFLIFFPLVIAVLLFVLKPIRARLYALSASVIELCVSVIMTLNFNNDDSFQFSLSVPWVASAGIYFNVAVDGISLLLVLLTTFLVPFIILSSFAHKYEKSQAFYGLVLIMQMALIGVFTALDGFLFYVFWEMALIPIYFICLIWGGEDRGRITFKFFIYTLAGSLFMLLALVYLYFQTPGSHTFDIEALYQAGRNLPSTDQSILFWGLFIAFAIKMPVFPFHTWQPDTYTNAPVQGTMLLSGIMLKMGIYGVIRWLIPVVPEGVQIWGSTAVVLSVIGIVYASCIAIIQKDIKRLIAYSSIAHVGLIAAGTLTVSKIGIQGAMIQMISHGIIVFALFYIIDIISLRTKTSELARLGGIRNLAPALTTVFIIVILGSIALPLTSGFVGEFLLLNSLFRYKLIIGLIAGLTIILGAVYMLRSFQKAMSGEPNENTALFTDLSKQEKMVLYPMVLVILIIGIYPAPILSISEPAVNKILSVFSSITVTRLNP